MSGTKWELERDLKGKVHPEMQFCNLFTLPYVIPNLYGLILPNLETKHYSSGQYTFIIQYKCYKTLGNQVIKLLSKNEQAYFVKLLMSQVIRP